MRCFTLYLLLFSLMPGLVANTIEENNSQLNLMPVPAHVEITGTKFRLDDSFRMAIRGEADIKLYRGTNRALRRLSGRTGLFFSQDFLTPGVVVDSVNFFIDSESKGKVELGVDESYSLSVSASGIYLKAETDIGALRGLETFLQLLSVDEEGYYFPGMEIEDQPRFPWRGLLIDACRHFMPVEVIKRNLDGMAAVKLNVLHWHLSEDQGFRVESMAYPKLHLLGSDGFYYTQQQIREVLSYAEDRGIRVVPEFDVPGHATSWLVAYPELGSASGPYKLERNWGIFYPVLNPVKESTYEFLDKFFGEMAQLFPDRYFHIGGDEIEHQDYHEAKHWNENAEIQRFRKENNIPDNSALQAYFNNRILKILSKYNKIMVGWDEILHEDMPTNIIIQSWRGRDSMEKAARMGYQSILSNGYYIDLIYPADVHYLNDPLPADTPLSPVEQNKILGGEATMWAEFVTPETVDSRIWPRVAAIAERFWSPNDVTEVEDMYSRLDVISLQLEEHGLMHEKNYEMLLRRLARGPDIKVLKNFVDVIEPVKHYNRNRLRPHTSYSPLTRVVDAARPDAKVARIFRTKMAKFIEGDGKEERLGTEMKTQLKLWQTNHSQLLKLIKRSPILAEIEPLSEHLARVAEMGLQAMSMIEQNKKADEEWIKKGFKLLEDAKVPKGQTELMIIPALERLIVALGPGENLN